MLYFVLAGSSNLALTLVSDWSLFTSYFSCCQSMRIVDNDGKGVNDT